MRYFRKLWLPVLILVIILGGCEKQSIEVGSGADWLDVFDIDSGWEVFAGGAQDTEEHRQNTEENVQAPAVAAEGELEVHFIDVGQGDATLIRCGEYNMLIDAGENNQGEKVTGYLRSQGVERLDYVIGTHPHSDHIGGLDAVIQAFDVGIVILPDKTHTSKTFEDMLLVIEAKELAVTLPEIGMQYELGEAFFTIVAPVEEYGDNLNNWSVGIRLVHGSNRFIMTGDAEVKAEKHMLETGIDLSAEVLKLAHHGSNTSTHEAFYSAVDPGYVVISCGKDNMYGHPNEETMELLERSGAEVFRTDESGDIVVISDGTNLRWE